MSALHVILSTMMQRSANENAASLPVSALHHCIPLHVTYASLVSSEGTPLQSGICKALLIRAVGRQNLITEAMSTKNL